MPRVIPVAEAPDKSYFRIGIHAEPKSGKTRAATSLPWGPAWGESGIYVAWDPDSRSLESVLPHNIPRLIVVEPEEREVRGQYHLDAHDEAFKIASFRWKDKYPEVGTLIWDTVSLTALDLLMWYADNGVFSGDKGDKHLSVGTPGTPGYMAQPMEGDYGLVGGAIARLLGFLLRQPLNLILLFHSHEADKLGNNLGPGVVGIKAVKTVAGILPHLFWMESRSVPVRGSNPPRSEEKYIMHTQRGGRMMGGIRSCQGKNPLPEVILEEDPVHFWVALEQALRGGRK